MATICIDCQFHDAVPIPQPVPEGYVCPHYQPEWWAAQGWTRGWGDAAVMSLPHGIEILRKQEGNTVEYLILSLTLRRPVLIDAAVVNGHLSSWGSY